MNRLIIGTIAASFLFFSSEAFASCFIDFDGFQRQACEAYREGKSCFIAFNDQYNRGWCEHLKEGKSCFMAFRNQNDQNLCKAGIAPNAHTMWLGGGGASSGIGRNDLGSRPSIQINTAPKAKPTKKKEEVYYEDKLCYSFSAENGESKSSPAVYLRSEVMTQEKRLAALLNDPEATTVARGAAVDEEQRKILKAHWYWMQQDDAIASIKQAKAECADGSGRDCFVEALREFHCRKKERRKYALKKFKRSCDLGFESSCIHNQAAILVQEQREERERIKKEKAAKIRAEEKAAAQKERIERKKTRTRARALSESCSAGDDIACSELENSVDAKIAEPFLKAECEKRSESACRAYVRGNGFKNIGLGRIRAGRAMMLGGGIGAGSSGLILLVTTLFGGDLRAIQIPLGLMSGAGLAVFGTGIGLYASGKKKRSFAEDAQFQQQSTLWDFEKYAGAPFEQVPQHRVLNVSFSF